jgi:protein disulfide isomerase family A protein 3
MCKSKSFLSLLGRRFVILKMFPLFLLVVGAAVVAKADVLDLTDETFKKELGNMETVLVIFCLPGCKICEHVLPNFERAAPALLANDPPVSLAKVNCITGPATCENFDIHIYPTLLIFDHGELSGTYEGPLGTKDIVKNIKNYLPAGSKDSEKANATDAGAA